VVEGSSPNCSQICTQLSLHPTKEHALSASLRCCNLCDLKCFAYHAGVTLMVAIRSVAAGARSAGLGFLEYVKSGRDPVSVAIMAEVQCCFYACRSTPTTGINPRARKCCAATKTVETEGVIETALFSCLRTSKHCSGKQLSHVAV
jgi:hypothetical protein